MANDEHGMPVPSEDRPLPWDFCDNRDSWKERDGLDLREFWAELDDAEFAKHAANNIIECREIVRRLAEHYKTEPSETFCGNKLYRICDDAARLWAKMQREVGDGA